MLVLAVAGYAIYHSFRHVTAALPPGCQAGTGEQAITLDTDQAAIAATIAGVAARHRLPRQAVTIALAAALQESKLHNLDYGDRDSVGIFQQRPSQGWGPAAELEDPVYATTKFFAALTQVPGYTKTARLPGRAGRPAQRGRIRLRAVGLGGRAAGRLLHRTATARRVLLVQPRPGRVTWRARCGGWPRRSGRRGGKPWWSGSARIVRPRRTAQRTEATAVLHVQRDAAWTVASWLVAHAQAYGLSEVRYAGYEWKAADGSMGWQPDPGPNGFAATAVLSQAEASQADEPPYCDSSRDQEDDRSSARDLHHRAALR